MDLQCVLITGSAGLIGRALTKFLIKQGIKVVEFDIQFPAQSMNYGDVRDNELLTEKLEGCQGVIHLAAVSRVVWGELDPQRCWDINVTGTSHVLKAAYQAKQRPWVIYASSREVYGQQKRFPVAEQAPLIPLNVYARSKVEAEKLVNEYRQQGLTTAILRFSSVYGSINDHADRVIPAFCRGAVQGKSLRIDGIDNLFDFTHVTDTVNGIVKALTYLQTSKEGLSPIHLTTGYGTSLIQVIELIEQVLEKSLSIQQAPARTYDVHHFYGDPSQAKQLLGWEAQTSLIQGLKRLIKDYQTHFSAAAV